MLARVFALLALVVAHAEAATVDPRLLHRAGPTPAIVVLRHPHSLAEAERLRQRVGAAELQLRRVYRNFPVLAVIASPAAIAKLALEPEVRHVGDDARVHAMLAEGTALIRANAVHSAGKFGAGQVVAVIDTGIDYDHSELGGGGFPNAKVIGGYDFANNDSKPDDDEGHGTAVAGIIASSAGVAPAAKLVALKVLDDEGSGEDSDILDAIDWAIDHRAELGITLMNLSLGGEHYKGHCDGDQPEYAEAFGAATTAGIAVFVAAGNEAKTDRLSSPACISMAISVGAVYDANGLDGREYCEAYDPLGVFCIDQLCKDGDPDADEICCYSNSASELDVLAPASDCRTLKKGGGWEDDFGGTSAATPYAAGVAALALEAGGARSPDSLKALLRATGVAIVDKRNGLTHPRVDAAAAVAAAVPTCQAPPAPIAAGSTTAAAGQSYTISWGSLAEVTEYEIEEYLGAISGLPKETRRTPATSAAFVHGDAAASTWYYRVRAYRACGAGSWSNPVAVNVLAAGGPGSQPENRVVAAAAHAPGDAGTTWRTDLVLFNPGSQTASVSVSLLERDRSGAEPPTLSLSLTAGELVELEDVVFELVGRDAAGALLIGSDRAIEAGAHTFNSATGATFGQSFPAQDLSDGLVASDAVADLLLLRSNADFRTNVGAVNASANAVTVRIRFNSRAGGELGSYQRTIAPWSTHQDTDVLAAYGEFPGAEVRAEVEILSGSGPVLAYASVVDRRSGDPLTVLAEKR